MRRIGTPRLTWLLALLLACCPAPTSQAALSEEPTTSDVSTTRVDAPQPQPAGAPDGALERGLDQERQRNDPRRIPRRDALSDPSGTGRNTPLGDYG